MFWLSAPPSFSLVVRDRLDRPLSAGAWLCAGINRTKLRSWRCNVSVLVASETELTKLRLVVNSQWWFLPSFPANEVWLSQSTQLFYRNCTPLLKIADVSLRWAWWPQGNVLQIQYFIGVVTSDTVQEVKSLPPPMAVFWGFKQAADVSFSISHPKSKQIVWRGAMGGRTLQSCYKGHISRCDSEERLILLGLLQVKRKWKLLFPFLKERDFFSWSDGWIHF